MTLQKIPAHFTSGDLSSPCGSCRPPSKFHQEGPQLQTPIAYSTEDAAALAEETKMAVTDSLADFTTEAVAPVTDASCLDAPCSLPQLQRNLGSSPATSASFCGCVHARCSPGPQHLTLTAVHVLVVSPLQLQSNANSEAPPHSCL